MTATTTSIVKRPATVWSTEKKKGGSAAVAGTAFTAVTDVNGALDVCSAAKKAEHVVAEGQIGKATSVLS